MHVDDLLGTENLAAEAGNAMLAKSNRGEKLGLHEAVDQSPHGRRLHVDHVGRTDVIANPAARALFNLDIFDHAAPSISTVPCQKISSRNAKLASSRRIARQYGLWRPATIVHML
jgi:hypothetical protein